MNAHEFFDNLNGESMIPFDVLNNRHTNRQSDNVNNFSRDPLTSQLATLSSTHFQGNSQNLLNVMESLPLQYFSPHQMINSNSTWNTITADHIFGNHFETSIQNASNSLIPSTLQIQQIDAFQNLSERAFPLMSDSKRNLKVDDIGNNSDLPFIASTNQHLSNAFVPSDITRSTFNSLQPVQNQTTGGILDTTIMKKNSALANLLLGPIEDDSLIREWELVIASADIRNLRDFQQSYNDNVARTTIPLDGHCSSVSFKQTCSSDERRYNSKQLNNKGSVTSTTNLSRKKEDIATSERCMMNAYYETSSCTTQSRKLKEAKLPQNKSIHIRKHIKKCPVTKASDRYKPGILIPLSLESDEVNFSPFQTLLRKQIYLFAARTADLECNAQGRNKPISLGQVGVVCRYCSETPPGLRQAGSVYFPSTTCRMYQAAQNMYNNHLCARCPCMPDKVRNELLKLKASKVLLATGGGKQLWAENTKQLGVIYDVTTDSLRFSFTYDR